MENSIFQQKNNSEKRDILIYFLKSFKILINVRQMFPISVSFNQQIVNITHYAGTGKPHSTVYLLKDESKNDK